MQDGVSSFYTDRVLPVETAKGWSQGREAQPPAISMVSGMPHTEGFASTSRSKHKTLRMNMHASQSPKILLEIIRYIVRIWTKIVLEHQTIQDLGVLSITRRVILIDQEMHKDDACLLLAGGFSSL